MVGIVIAPRVAASPPLLRAPLIARETELAALPMRRLDLVDGIGFAPEQVVESAEGIGPALDREEPHLAVELLLQVGHRSARPSSRTFHFRIADVAGVEVRAPIPVDV